MSYYQIITNYLNSCLSSVRRSRANTPWWRIDLLVPLWVEEIVILDLFKRMKR